MTNYPTNLSNSQWQIISKFLNLQRNRRYSLREIINAILYVVKTGCQWRMLPHDFPRWEIVYYYFSSWRSMGIWNQLHDGLVSKIRISAGRKEQPTAGIIDSQSVKCTLVSSEDKGFDAGKRVKGIKRHIIVDVMGLILAVFVQSASVQDRDGAKPVIEYLALKWKKIRILFADAGYRGALLEWVKKQYRFRMKIVEKTKKGQFEVLPQRWIVERTFAWLDTNRRNSKNYERLNKSSVAMVHISAIRHMLNRF
jgi:putative transposase